VRENRLLRLTWRGLETWSERMRAPVFDPTGEERLGNNLNYAQSLTLLRTKRGWHYLTVIIDLYDRKVVGWAMSEGLTAAETIVLAWFMAITNRPITCDLIFHSDRVVQYASEEFAEILKTNELITRSMSRKGNC